ncbi:MAG: [FeFe] hydrogenase H-cluster radical SAM maturase HydG [Kiritimatiellaeota bacterium]|nr:[FeFe] hydrogenase H-cluster radical SAM maturase HydG [Kiritimatiellota bacterium]
MVDPKSQRAEDFIHDGEIMETLALARERAADAAFVRDALDKARQGQGLTHREALTLLECQKPEERHAILEIARDIKRRFYGNRIVLFAPLYLSNYCVNGCSYCPYHAQNGHIPRRKLTQDEIAREAAALQAMGHKRLAIETGEDPVHAPLSYVLDSIQTIYATCHERGAIRRVNVNIAATTVDEYRQLKAAGIGTYILFQETYHKATYERLHPFGPKGDYAWHTEAMDRAMAGGIDDVGLGALFGLGNYRYDVAGLLLHAEHLQAACGVGPHTISVPRIRPADDIRLDAYTEAIDDDTFERLVAVLRLAVPYTGIIVSTRESPAVRARILDAGVTQISGGSRTSVGGYAGSAEHQLGNNDTAQFEVNDTRSLDDVVRWLLDIGHIPSFCTACYRQGRTGDRFMQLVHAGAIADCCHPNALVTLAEYLADYASPETRLAGTLALHRELSRIASPATRDRTAAAIAAIPSGQRDFFM